MSNDHLNAVRKCRLFKGTTRLLLFVLADRASTGKPRKDGKQTLPYGCCFPSLPRLMMDLNTNRRSTVCDAMKELLEAGVIKRKRRNNAASLTFVNIERIEELAYTPEEEAERMKKHSDEILNPSQWDVTTNGTMMGTNTDTKVVAASGTLSSLLIASDNQPSVSGTDADAEADHMKEMNKQEELPYPTVFARMQAYSHTPVLPKSSSDSPIVESHTSTAAYAKAQGDKDSSCSLSATEGCAPPPVAAAPLPAWEEEAELSTAPVPPAPPPDVDEETKLWAETAADVYERLYPSHEIDERHFYKIIEEYGWQHVSEVMRWLPTSDYWGSRLSSSQDFALAFSELDRQFDTYLLKAEGNGTVERALAWIEERLQNRIQAKRIEWLDKRWGAPYPQPDPADAMEEHLMDVAEDLQPDPIFYPYAEHDWEEGEDDDGGYIAYNPCREDDADSGYAQKQPRQRRETSQVLDRLNRLIDGRVKATSMLFYDLSGEFQVALDVVVRATELFLDVNDRESASEIAAELGSTVKFQSLREYRELFPSIMHYYRESLVKSLPMVGS